MKKLMTLLFVAWCALAPSPAVAAEPFFFVQLSDPQMGMFSDNRDFSQDAANFEFAVTAINRLRPAFVVITGDLVNKSGDAPQIAEYLRITKKIDAAIPVYSIPGNHDVGNVPSSMGVANYVKIFGPDHYVFKHQGFVGVALNSTVIHTPQYSTEELSAQESWLRAELGKAKSDGARHIVVFQHHPWFIASATEPDQYFNIPLSRRTSYLSLFRESGVRYLFSGHYHRNAEGRDGELVNIITGPVGKPLGGAKSGLRVAIVRDEVIEHRYYELGDLPVKIELAPPASKPAAGKN